MDSEPDPNQSRKADYVVQRTRRRLMATDAKEYHRLLDRNPALGLPGQFTDRDQILHQLRALKEKEHRENTSALFVREYMPLVDISEFHHRIVQSLSPDAFKSITSQMLQELPILPVPPPSRQPQEEPFTTLSRSHKVPPLFKSLFIVVHQTQVSRTERFTVEETDNIPVTLVQTGSMEGLKHPISVRTNLKSAIRFVLDLEKREEVFWGTKPRPPLADSSVDVEKEARELGWDDATHGKLPLDQPSST
ncbi:uncharacterized protein FSUBG_11288 [Fusarium subglutinans]|uniref:Uncharacterized protein n=1 Tax=Gibberella subglutinans TaxID=42677 RepID=A0A8H5LD65_GIBSU|nr:uncharacterized protein FSUBG_11288 [Fusarium subglutinans]KAF5589037.1 hypothetical protein FSUBG_11288 [Fusarium subglutinans]